MKHIVFFAVAICFFQSYFLHSKNGHTNTLCANQTEQSYSKTAITISNPNSNTVWMSPGKAKLEWSTENIPENKTIQFYLSKDDMVVQELGIFSNTNFIDEIQLDPGMEGDNYRVFGIELFPEDKYSIAKFATSMFTIKKVPRVKSTVVEKIPEKPVIRENFDGRSINYVKELNVTGANIQINLWDHGRKDGDIVSIYLNGEAIVSKYLLEYTKKVFELKLDPNKPNDLFLYAHNLGQYPPNTVSIEITDGAVSENIILNSDLKSCEAVLINVTK
ncbi:hypothetical protein FEE95_11525 [Maribacter algarum]|uniref:Uncharacterized protein n=1 Tax=Maribacter algarum (ex Zhang et al. 2020) TaxID=2578118 RepID=A0A5S3PQZ2_9FLAO|nr:hypothetical protein [Maribacter algarum]TMM57114.1 hypothetical protein FEE95_11525 [Maribacter algarum]